MLLSQRVTQLALVLDLVLGTMLATAAAVFAALWLWPGVDPHGGVFALIPAFWTSPAAGLFFVAAWAHMRDARDRWVVQAFPFVYAALPAALLALA